MCERYQDRDVMTFGNQSRPIEIFSLYLQEMLYNRIILLSFDIHLAFNCALIYLDKKI